VVYDVNDADYRTSLVLINDKEETLVRKMLKALKEEDKKNRWGHNFEDFYEKLCDDWKEFESGNEEFHNGFKNEFITFDDLIEFSELFSISGDDMGEPHTIERIEILDIVSIDKLL
jgi:hypothetical protein